MSRLAAAVAVLSLPLLGSPAQAAVYHVHPPAEIVGRPAPTADRGELVTRSTAAPSADAIWGWCGLFDGDQKVVRAFERYRGDAGGRHRLKGGTSNLRCGSTEESGYRHIQAGHQSQWEFDAWLVGTNWRNQADFAIATVLRDPDRVTYNARNDTYCYSRLVYLERKADRRVVGDRTPNVVVGAGNSNIITAFPSNYNCRQVK